MQVDAAATLLDSFSSAKSKITFSFAPGRVNLIGEHTDYNQGFVFPVAMTQGITIAARENGLSVNRLFSNKAGRGRSFPSTPQPGSVHGWSRYVAAISWVLQSKTCFDMAVVSNLPMSSGVSSSAALELAAATLWNHHEKLSHSPQQLALLSQKAENQFVGVNCGIMDQMASAMGKANHAILLDTRDNSITYAPLDSEIIIFVLDTGMPRSLAESGYNQRRATCEAACKSLDISSLRDATLSDLDKLTDSLELKRAKHVITENQRCQDFARALADNNLELIGNLMNQSHLSLEHDYEVSSPELNSMVLAANESKGCIGARMTGAGFGGCAIALVKREFEQEFRKECELYYRKRVKHSKEVIFETSAGDGARIIS